MIGRRNGFNFAAFILALIAAISAFFSAIGGFTCGGAASQLPLVGGFLSNWLYVAAGMTLAGGIITLIGGIFARNGRLLGVILLWVSLLLPVIAVIVSFWTFGFAGAALLSSLPAVFSNVLVLLAVIFAMIGRSISKRTGV